MTSRKDRSTLGQWGKAKKSNEATFKAEIFRRLVNEGYRTLCEVIVDSKYPKTRTFDKLDLVVYEGSLPRLIIEVKKPQTGDSIYKMSQLFLPNEKTKYKQVFKYLLHDLPVWRISDYDGVEDIMKWVKENIAPARKPIKPTYADKHIEDMQRFLGL